MKEKMMGAYPTYEIERCAEKIQEAEEIKRDPAKMKEVRKILKRKIESIADLKEILKEKSEESESEDDD